MRLNSKRKFKSDTNQTYLVQDMYKSDRKGKEKYNLFRVDGEMYCKLCYGPFLEPLKFETIRDAQFFVMMNEELIQYWN